MKPNLEHTILLRLLLSLLLGLAAKNLRIAVAQRQNKFFNRPQHDTLLNNIFGHIDTLIDAGNATGQRRAFQSSQSVVGSPSNFYNQPPDGASYNSEETNYKYIPSHPLAVYQVDRDHRYSSWQYHQTMRPPPFPAAVSPQRLARPSSTTRGYSIVPRTDVTRRQRRRRTKRFTTTTTTTTQPIYQTETDSYYYSTEDGNDHGMTTAANWDDFSTTTQSQAETTELDYLSTHSDNFKSEPAYINQDESVSTQPAGNDYFIVVLNTTTRSPFIQVEQRIWREPIRPPAKQDSEPPPVEAQQIQPGKHFNTATSTKSQTPLPQIPPLPRQRPPSNIDLLRSYFMFPPFDIAQRMGPSDVPFPDFMPNFRQTVKSRSRTTTKLPILSTTLDPDCLLLKEKKAIVAGSAKILPKKAVAIFDTNAEGSIYNTGYVLEPIDNKVKTPETTTVTTTTTTTADYNLGHVKMPWGYGYNLLSNNRRKHFKNDDTRKKPSRNVGLVPEMLLPSTTTPLSSPRIIDVGNGNNWKMTNRRRQPSSSHRRRRRPLRGTTTKGFRVKPIIETTTFVLATGSPRILSKAALASLVSDEFVLNKLRQLGLVGQANQPRRKKGVGNILEQFVLAAVHGGNRRRKTTTTPVMVRHESRPIRRRYYGRNAKNFSDDNKNIQEITTTRRPRRNSRQRRPQRQRRVRQRSNQQSHRVT